MKQKYIDSLLSEIELLSTKVETLKESKRVPFSFFKASFKRTQEISRLLHELEFVQIEEMRGEMEKLVQYLSAAEKTKKENEAKAAVIAEKQKEAELKHKAEEKDQLTPTQPASKEETASNEEDAPVVNKEQKRPALVADKEQEAIHLIDETKPNEQQDKKEEKTDWKEQPEDQMPKEKDQSVSPSPVLTGKSEKVLADIAPKNKSLNDIHPINQTIQDVRRSISLNDQFLFQRELFNNNREAMNAMLAKLQSFSSFDLVESYLKRNTTWDFKNETVDKFLQMLKERY